MGPDPLVYQLAIDMIPMVGSVHAKRLIAYCGGVEAVFRQSRKALLKVPGIGERIAHEVFNQGVLARAAREVEFIRQQGLSAWFYLDEGYPHRLRQCDDGPVVLFGKGCPGVSLNPARVISVVGTRSMTDYGRAMCEGLLEQLAARGHRPLVVSGLAYGVDVCAHRASLRHGLPTAAVLGHGLDTMYPSAHRAVAESIARQGMLLTDFPSQTPFDRNNFIKRNRIIAGLADATIVVESDLRGGSLITAELAQSYNRDVLAFPGDAGSRYSRGCNHLIKTHRAALVESAEDLEYHLNWSPPGAAPRRAQPTLFPSLSPEEQLVLEAIRETGQELMDVISLKTQIPTPRVAAALLALEFAGLIRSRPGKLFVLA